MRSDAYWERRYRRGGDSGEGSREAAAEAKAAWVNNLMRREGVGSVLDVGCGDGAQLALLEVPEAYLGIDVSATAIRRCLKRWPKRQFARLDPITPLVSVQADLALSLDVMFHLPADADYVAHLHHLFDSARRLVAVHSTDYDAPQHGHHLRRRRFTVDVDAAFGRDWVLAERPDDPGVEGFYLYRRRL